MIIIKIIIMIVVSLQAGWMMGTIEYFMGAPNAGAYFAFATTVAFLLYVIIRKDQ